MLELELPWPPSTNTYYRTLGRGRVVISKKGRIYREKIVALISQLGLKPMEGKLFANIEYYPPDKRVRDIDNFQKALLDSLTHAGVWIDDRQVRRM